MTAAKMGGKKGRAKGVVGIDVGGSFIDRVLKVLSTPQDPSQSLVDALAAAGIEPEDVDIIVHGTTIATNAVIERTSTAVVQGYLQPLVARYAKGLERRLAGRAGFANVVTGDMGGTSYDVAAPNRVRLVTQGREWAPPLRSKIEKQALSRGDSLHLASPGGGGFGHPLERRLEDVELDLNHGLIGLDTAKGVDGAVVAPTRALAGRPIYRIDHDASQKQRARMAAAATHGGSGL